MTKIRTLRQARQRRHQRLRQRVRGTADRPRLSVFRSLNHIYAQVIDDTLGVTLLMASTKDKDLRAEVEGLPKSDQARHVGQAIARRAQGQGVVRVVFDRGGNAYHGRVRAVAEGARSAGLEF
ncbi:MAG: 50S ribosomal protein L18 [Chloroflexi bacterium]|nr:50S ribosomal protein L18 [Chloroflexota bacterium]